MSMCPRSFVNALVMILLQSAGLSRSLVSVDWVLRNTHMRLSRHRSAGTEVNGPGEIDLLPLHRDIARDVLYIAWISFRFLKTNFCVLVSRIWIFFKKKW